MANPPTKTPSLLLEAIKFASSISADTPYEELTKTAVDGGWAWHLRQADVVQVINATGTPNFLVTFDVLLGKTDGDLQAVDQLTVQVSGNVSPVSSAARQNASTALLHLFFGRLPPAPVPQQPESVQTRPHNGYNDTDEAEEANQGGGIDYNVVERHTPDGLPIFVDLYELGIPGPVVTETVLNEIESVLPNVTTVPALMALWQQNTEAFQYVQDLGNPDQRAELKRMLDRRKGELEAMASDVAPRRRSSPQVVN